MNRIGDDLVISSFNEEIIRAFSRYDVEFIVFGGLAVAYYNCRKQPADDMDLLVDATPQNSKRIYDALISLGQNWNNLNEQTFAKPGQKIHLAIPYNADILTPRKGDPEYLETIEEAINIKTSKSCPVKIVSVEMLIKMKEIAAADYLPERETSHRY